MDYASIEEFKADAEFFPRGRIIPQRIMKGPRKHKHSIVFGADAYALSTPNGYVVALDQGEDTCAIKIKNHIKYANFVGSPYTKLSRTAFVGNYQLKVADWLKSINEAIAWKAESQEGDA